MVEQSGMEADRAAARRAIARVAAAYRKLVSEAVNQRRLTEETTRFGDAAVQSIDEAIETLTIESDRTPEGFRAAVEELSDYHCRLLASAQLGGTDALQEAVYGIPSQLPRDCAELGIHIALSVLQDGASESSVVVSAVRVDTAAYDATLAQICGPTVETPYVATRASLHSWQTHITNMSVEPYSTRHWPFKYVQSLLTIEVGPYVPSNDSGSILDVTLNAALAKWIRLSPSEADVIVSSQACDPAPAVTITAEVTTRYGHAPTAQHTAA